MKTTIRSRRGRPRLAAQAQARVLPRLSQLAYLYGAYFLIAISFAIWALRLL